MKSYKFGLTEENIAQAQKMSKEEADALADRLNSEDDDWYYEVFSVFDKFVIATFDEEAEFVGLL